ncbi:MAG: DNA polymerase subunit beta [Parcubacteria group bacterium Gr01-1014_18]|nr:MAG: DNA polymerase subunit beta [Parcubacteria group bacterium Greene0416_36]TSC79779.1 MAG: DNA polymerase subunit beta [Parcubacteria group bacterium Gr01-1014_18]TSC98063.1 MAG: DNA polymerase subunit beta [Parcubacteria group bacterium Greene1014_20]TSD06499.1 MAG: DNA polymerase subunit beta [Parcubacteria group bacterium Greene0714_2]
MSQRKNILKSFRKAPVATKQEIFDRVLANKNQLRKLGASKLGLFGSFVRNEARANSDVDLIVEFLPGQKTYHNLFNLGEELEGILGRRVEVLTPESISKYFRNDVLESTEYVQISN